MRGFTYVSRHQNVKDFLVTWPAQSIGGRAGWQHIAPPPLLARYLVVVLIYLVENAKSCHATYLVLAW